MRRLIAAVALGLVLVSSVPASAYLVEVTTSVAVEDAGDQSQVRAAIRTPWTMCSRGRLPSRRRWSC